MLPVRREQFFSAAEQTIYKILYVKLKQLDNQKDLEVCHPRCVKLNITVYNMYVLTYIFSQKHNN